MVTMILLVVFAATTARLFVWPSLSPLPDHADAIIELAGPGNRDAVTMALAEENLAPIVLQSTIPEDATSDACLPPVREVSIGCFSPVPATTRGEARYIGDRGGLEDWSSVIVVTTPDHAWRARRRIQRCFSGRVYVETSPLSAMDWFRQIPYQWAATIKSELFQRDC
jgi:uncharacterized SAM-binding protein YcdF (DUF218 family)